MYIDQILPAVIGARDTLRNRLASEAHALRLTDVEIAEIQILLPPNLAAAECFEDRLTSHWRYEYGEYFDLRATKQCLWGTHMWVRVDTLVLALSSVLKRVPQEKRSTYILRLDDPTKHHDTLSEMVPVIRLDPLVSADFEVAGLGFGNTTVDWHFCTSDGRAVLLDVKSRVVDLINQMDRISNGNEPDHDAGLMFRGLENKFIAADPDKQLQGAWVGTHIKQERSELLAAFEALDPQKVHFAIFGDWEPDVLILTRRTIDKLFLIRLFGVAESDRFTFDRGSAYASDNPISPHRTRIR